MPTRVPWLDGQGDRRLRPGGRIFRLGGSVSGKKGLNPVAGQLHEGSDVC